MQPFLTLLRRASRGLTILVVAAAVLRRGWDALRRRRAASGRTRRAEREVLPSLFDRHPTATTAPRRRLGLHSIPLDRVVGTMRHPSQNTADFLPLPRLRGQNWQARWQRIDRAMSRLTTLPPVDVVQVGDDYYVADGHNRVAAARQAGGVDIDADVTQLLIPGLAAPRPATFDPTLLMGAGAVRQAARGRQSRGVEERDAIEEVSRRDLADDAAEHR